MGQGWGREKNADSRDALKLLPVESADVGEGWERGEKESGPDIWINTEAGQASGWGG